VSAGSCCCWFFFFFDFFQHLFLLGFISDGSCVGVLFSQEQQKQQQQQG
jgi:hypothetical protein